MRPTILIEVGPNVHDRAVAVWGAREAERAGGVVHIVHAYGMLHLSGSSWPAAVQANDARRANARGVVAAAVNQIRLAYPQLEVSGSAIDGDTIDVLLDAARLADLVVVGRLPDGHDDGRTRGGHVGRRVAAVADCPVVVVPTGADTGPIPADGAVCLVIDEPDLPVAAVDFAFAAARERRVSLVVVLAQPEAATLPAPDLAYWETFRQQVLDAELSSWQRTFPDVGVVVEVRREDAVTALGVVQNRSQLLVVGRGAVVDSGRSPRSGSRMARQLMAHAYRPIAVVPDAYVGSRSRVAS